MPSELAYVHRLRADLTSRLAGLGPRAAGRGALEHWLSEVTRRELQLRLNAERPVTEPDPDEDDRPLPWWHR